MTETETALTNEVPLEGLPSATIPEGPELRRRWSRLGGKGLVGVVILALFVIVALFAPLLAPHDPLQQNILDRLADPSSAHWLGTDSLGRDVLSRLIYATRIDLPLGFALALLPAVVGTIIGALAGYFGRLTDTVLMRTADLVQAFPIYIFIIALVYALGPGAKSLLIAFVVVAWVIYARLIRAEVLRIRELDYVQAARAGGLSHARILARHVVPNAVSQTIAYFPADILLAIVSLAALSFLGLGIQPPTPEWGAMITEGQPYIQKQWWLVTVPGIVIIVLGAGLMLLADTVDDRVRLR